MQNDNAKLKIDKILGIDYGKAKVGLAIADNETRIAFGYGVLENNHDFFNKLADIIKKEDISAVVIGIPSYINREETEYDGEKLGEYLKTIIGLKVEYQNEMFTTKLAQEKLKEKGMKNIKDLDDQEAARIILQEWLESVNRKQ
jgi:putative Holliday junction resolvase